MAPSLLTVSADGSGPERAAVEGCLRALDRVRVLVQSGPEHVPLERADAITPEQAGRAGTDGTAQCRSAAVLDLAPGADPGSTFGYLTDATGYEQWEWEYTGGLRISPVEPPTGDGLYALCWLRGDIPPNTSVDAAPGGYAYQLLTVQLSGSDPGVRMDKRSAVPCRCLPPSGPDDQHLPGTRPAQVVHPQPGGVVLGGGSAAVPD
jgi:hypothetical protein